MSIRIFPDEDQPSAAIEIPLEKPLPDYDLEEVEKPTPRDVDGILVSQGFRDLVDDARGVLVDILAHPPAPHASKKITDLNIAPTFNPPLEIAQLTGAICPGHGEVYRPGLWIVLRDPAAPPKNPPPPTALDRINAAAKELVKRLQLE
ncbi:MAG TPA: hypothetical protein VLX32_08750 [Candidatus Acidoferrum sp.]|nr:hypothetical protein [Candidatus Acidoferrum sp.]